MEENSGLTPSEEAAFENGGTTDPESGDAVDDEVESTGGEAENTPKESAPAEPAPKVKMVPHAALHEARMEAKETRERMAKMEQTFQQIQQRIQQQNQPQIPDINDDAVGHFVAKQQQLEQQQQQIVQYQQQQFEQQQAQQQENNFRNQLSSIESQFAQSNPDYSQASDFLRTSIQKDFEMMGMTAQAASAATYNQLKFMIIQAAEAGNNPAEQAYAVAKARGYGRQENTGNAALNKIANIKNGQNAAKSLSGTSGKGESGITLEALAEMDADELEKNWHKIAKLM